MPAKKGELVSKFKKNIKTFLIEERGGISKHKMISLGAFLGSVSLLSLLPPVAADHSNYFNVSWNAGTLTGKHGHHASHSSHGSHGSHASHASHSSHGSHSSCHSSHASCGCCYWC